MLKKEEVTPGEAAPAEVTTDTVVKPKEEVTPEKTEEKTVGEIANEGAPVIKEKETVGLDKFLDEKNKRKQAEKDLADLRESIEKGATKKEIASDIATLAKEHDLDPDFLQKFADTIKVQTEQSLDDKYAPKLSAMEKKERDAKIDAAFNTHFNLAMDKMPDMKDIVVPSVIKTLSLDPANSKKTITQLIEEVYGNTLPGKRTAEKTTPGGGKEPAPLDMARARKDTTYFKEIMADPALKAEYNKRMLREGL